MNKAIINDEIVIAYDVLKKSEIVENGKIKKTWRGQISTFGAAVTMGSLIPAVAFFSDQGGSSVKRQCIMDAILEILKRDYGIESKEELIERFESSKGINIGIFTERRQTA